MTLMLKDLDAITRGHMLAVLEDDAASGRLEMPELLTREGLSAYVNCLRDAAQHGDERTLARSLQNPAWWKKRDGRGTHVEVEQASVRLATTEFVTLYTDGMYIRLKEEGEQLCRVYLAGSEPEPNCAGSRLEGKVVRMSNMLMWHEGEGRPIPRIPFSPDCRHTICRIDSAMAPRCPECGAPLYYGAITQKYSCVACMHTTTHEEMLRNPVTPKPRRGPARATEPSLPPDTLANPPERPVLLAICAKGHIVDSMVIEPSAYHGKFCPECSRPISVYCPACSSPIRRTPLGAPATFLPAGAKPPQHCMECAARFPWATRLRQARHSCSAAWGRLCGMARTRKIVGWVLMAIMVTGAIIAIVEYIPKWLK